MSSIPTPLGSNRSGSRLPNPISAPNPVPMSSSTSMLKPPTSVVGLGNNAASKRPRADPEDGNVAKRQALQRSNSCFFYLKLFYLLLYLPFYFNFIFTSCFLRFYYLNFKFLFKHLFMILLVLSSIILFRNCSNFL